MKLSEKRLIDLEGFDRAEAQLELLDHRHQLLAINELDRWDAISNRFFPRLRSERPCRNDDPLIRAPLHRTAKVPNLARGNGSRITLALKQHLEADQRAHLQNAEPVDTPITRATADGYLLEARFSEEPLTKTLKTGWREAAKSLQQLLSIVDRSGRRCILGRCCFCLLGFGRINNTTINVELCVDVLEDVERFLVCKASEGQTLLCQCPNPS